MNTSSGIFVLDINHMNKLNFSFRSIALIGAFLAIGFSSFAQSNKTVYLAWFETNNLKKDFQFITPKLLKGYLNQGARYEAVTPNYGDSVSGSWLEISEIQNRAKEKNAAYYVLGTLTRLGETVIVDINLNETSTGKRLWSDKLRVNGPDDLDPIMQRVALAIGTENTSTKEGDIYNVSTYESKELKKQQATYSFGTSIGSMIGFRANSELMAGGSFVGSYDNRNLVLDFRGSYYGFGSENSAFYSFGLEVLKPLKKDANTVFLTGGLQIAGYDWIESYYNGPFNYGTRDINYSGMVFNLGGGYLVGRTSSAQLRFSGDLLIGALNKYNGPFTGAQVKMEILFNR
jgi:hypothetical protein